MTRQDPVRNMMREAVKTLGWNDQLTIADELMRMERIRHLPVLDEDGALVGIVSQRDLFRGALARALGYGEHAQESVLAQLVVKGVMVNIAARRGLDASVSAAARIMLDQKIGCLPVVKGGKLVGIVTESDFLAKIADKD